MTLLCQRPLAAIALSLGIVLLGGLPGHSAEKTPLMVTYGASAQPIQGDPTPSQVVYLSVPENTAGKLYLRIFDPETIGKYDLIYRGANTTMRYEVFGGKGAYAGAKTQVKDTPKELTGGTLLSQARFGTDRKTDGKWETIAVLRADQGDLVEGRRIFRLVVAGETGGDGNAYDIALSSRDDDVVRPQGLRIYSYAPTVRIPDRRNLTELRFGIPADAWSLTIGNFDAANGKVTLETAFRSVPLTPSGQDNWRTDDVDLQKTEAGKKAAITFAGGGEMPNDGTFYVKMGEKFLPIDLPPSLLKPNRRPKVVARVTQLETCKAAKLDASSSSDPDGQELSYVWISKAGADLTGPVVERTYSADGHYSDRLEVRDDSGNVGNGTAVPVHVWIKSPPLAKIDVPKVVAPGVMVAFDGTGSNAPGWKINDYLWSYHDGAVASGPRVERSFAAPGLYKIALAIKDSSGHVCDHASTDVTIRANAAPAPVIKVTRKVAIGEEIVLDGSGSSDADGRIVSYAWDFGDGATASGPVTRHAYGKAGTYTLRLTVDDGDNVANSVQSREITIFVNDPPVADAGPARAVAVGETIPFDADGSTDSDGKLIAYSWDFGDGTTDAGIAPTHAYSKAGTYTVRLKVEDDSTTSTRFAEATATIHVNDPPTADAGPERAVAVGETIPFDAGKSSDSDGKLISYVWDFGDGTTGTGVAPKHIYRKPGTYTVRLKVEDDSTTSTRFADATAIIHVNDPPVADAGKDRRVAVKEIITFDAAGSTDGDGKLIAYTWDFGDGTTASGIAPKHTYSRPGTYKVRVTVEDSSTTSTRFASSTVTVRVNDPPVAVAGPTRSIAVGETVPLDAGGSSDSDGRIIAYSWDFGNGTTGAGVTPSHAYFKPGTYTVRLTVEDDSTTSSRFGVSTATVHVNDPPVAVAGPERTVAVDETISFDGSGSSDSDGKLIGYVWDFGDGTTATGVAPTHAYAKPGVYTARLTVEDSSGTSTRFHSSTAVIRVNDQPTAVAGPARTVAVGETIPFDAGKSYDSDGKLIGYVWDFGDGSAGDGIAPAHAYSKPGTYTVKLTVEDNSTTSSRFAVSTATVHVNEPPIAKPGPDRSVAIGEDIPFDAGKSSDSDGKIVAYTWDFGDGATDVGVAPTHAYLKPGTYTVKLTVEDSSGTSTRFATSIATVRVNDPPAAVAGPARAVAVGEVIPFDASASTDPDGKLIGYVWDFGDGKTGTGVAPTHAFAKPGTYTVKLTVEDSSGTSTRFSSSTAFVHVNDPPVADAGESRPVAVGEIVPFDAGGSTDADGKLIGYSWDFGDGVKGTGTKPTHAYSKPGTYTVRLTVEDDSGTSSRFDGATATIRVNDPPVADAGKDRSVAIGEDIPFDASGSTDADGKLIAYTWDFGDGATGSGIAPAHAYSKAGTYTVRLTVEDNSTTSTRFHSTSATVRVNAPPVADAGPDQHVTRSRIVFDGTGSTDSDDRIARYEWTFGDGTTGSGPRPEHVYEQPGRYVVKLKVTDASGTVRSSHEDEMVVVINALPIADAGRDLIGAPGEKLVFQGNRSVDPDGKIKSYEWDFKDGTKASGKIVEHAFRKPGTYVVSLKVADDTGDENAIDHGETIVTINAKPVADAGADIRAAPGEQVKLDASRSRDPDGELVSYRWDFSDSEEPVFGAVVTRTFDKPGVYVAHLSVTDDAGVGNSIATDEVTIQINAAPVAKAGDDILSDTAFIKFDATGSTDADGDGLTYKWNFGDGTEAEGPVVSHRYPSSGVYPVLLTVNDGSKLGNAIASDSMIVRINAPPTARAGGNKRICSGDFLLLDGSKSSDPEGGVLRFDWDFGDGTNSQLVNPTKVYRRHGTYQVKLKVRDDSGFPNGVHSDVVAVSVDPAPVADAGADMKVCANHEFAFDGTKSWDTDGQINRFSWNFGDGDRGNGSRPKHLYRAPGTYRVELTVEGDPVGECEAVSTDIVVVEVTEGPIARIEAPAVSPVGTTVTFDGSKSSDAGGKISRWHWDFGDGKTAEGEKVAFTFDKPGRYPVVLTIDSDGAIKQCQTVSTRHVITINAAPVAVAKAPESASIGEELVFDGVLSKDPDGTIKTYSWDFGDGTKAEGVNVRHRYASAGTFTGRLTVDDGGDVPNSVATTEWTIVVHPDPVPTMAGPSVACVGERTDWTASHVGDVLRSAARYEWIFGDGTRNSLAKASHVFSRPGMVDVTLFADDGLNRRGSRKHLTRAVHVNMPPRPVLAAPAAACPGSPVSFDAGLSVDPDGGKLSYLWDFGDGNKASGVKAEHKFDKPGVYTVRLTVADDAGASCSSQSRTAKVVVNASPVAKAGRNRTVRTGGAVDEVPFSGENSVDPDGGTLMFTWDFGDGVIRSGERVRHGFSEPGKYPVTLTVDDSTGLPCGVATDTVTIDVKAWDGARKDP